MSTPQNEARSYNAKDLGFFTLYSLIGIFMFFVPITINGTSTIPLDHMVTALKAIPHYNLVFGLFMVVAGVLWSAKDKPWQKSTSGLVFFILKLLSLVFAFMYLTGTGPAGLHEPGMLPLIWNAILVSVATIVPIGSIFLGFITNFGLMEFIGVFMEKVMRPIFKTPGRSAVDAVASFVGSYSLALLITNRVYGEKRYTTREAAIIATGFSTVSATFMVIVARTLDIMDYWLLYFTLTAVVTFVVTALTIRLYPLNKKPDTYIDGTPAEKEAQKPISLRRATDEAMEVYKANPGVVRVMYDNLVDGFQMALVIAPSLLGVGMLGLILAEYTPIFDAIGIIFYPFTALTFVPEAMLTAQALATSIAEMLLPSAFVVGSHIITRFLVAVISVSAILFFSASIPCIMATDIPLTMKDYILLWLQRVILSILITAPILHLIF